MPKAKKNYNLPLCNSIIIRYNVFIILLLIFLLCSLILSFCNTVSKLFLTLPLFNIYSHFVILYYHNVFDIIKMLGFFPLCVFFLSFCYHPLIFST